MPGHAASNDPASRPSNQLPVLITGSGSAGLALAQGLRNAGIECHVFEKSDSFSRGRDWNMGLHWGAPILRSLMTEEMWSRIQTVQVDPHEPTKDVDTVTFFNGANGKIFFSLEMEYFYRLMRSKLRGLLSEGVDIQYSKQLSNISYAEDGLSVTAHFTDGSSATGCLLVAAEGARSTTRQLLLGSERGTINRIPYVATFVQRKFTRDQALFLRSFHPLYLASCHPNNIFGFFGMHHAAEADRPETWTFFFYISYNSSLEEQKARANWTDAQRLAVVKNYAKDYCEPWKSAFEWTPDDHPVWHMGLTDWDPGLDGHRWDNHGGLVTMIGDAVHPMTYQRGQGLNHSMTDSGKLRDAIVSISEGGDQKDLITAFEDEMIERGGLEVRTSTTNTRMLHDWEKIKQSPLFSKGMDKN